jgi:hypothetical protein
MGRRPNEATLAREREREGRAVVAPPTEVEEQESTEVPVTLEGAGLGSLFSASSLRWAAGVLESAITYGDDGLGMRDTEQARAIAKHLREQSAVAEA